MGPKKAIKRLSKATKASKQLAQAAKKAKEDAEEQISENQGQNEESESDHEVSESENVDNPPTKQADVPKKQAVVPKGQADVTQKQAVVPKGQADVTKKQAGAPKKQAEAPKNQAEKAEKTSASASHSACLPKPRDSYRSKITMTVPDIEKEPLPKSLASIKFKPTVKGKSKLVHKGKAKHPPPSPDTSDAEDYGLIEEDDEEDDQEDDEEDDGEEDGEEDGEDDEEDEDTQSKGKKMKTTKGTKKRARSAAITLTPEVEDEMVEWIRGHPLLYDKHLSEYRKAAYKKQLWTDKAMSIGLTFKQVQTWYESVRTRFGKLIRDHKSGDGAKVYTEREQWLLDKFDFLRNHIYRHSGRQGCSVSKIIHIIICTLMGFVGGGGYKFV